MISLTSSRQPARAPWSREKLVRERAIALGRAIDSSTFSTYTSHLQSYLAFCKSHNFPIDPTPDTLSFYTVFMCHHIKPDSVASYLSGICNQLESLYPNVRIVRKHPLVTRTLAGCKRMFNTPTKRKRALTVDDLARLLTVFPPTSHDNHLFRAMTLAGFFALHRLGELAVPDNAAFRDSRKLIRRTSLSVEGEFLRYVLPSHKADRFFEGSTIVLARRADDVVDAFAAMVAYTCSRDNLFPMRSELFLTAAGVPPTKTWYLSKLRTVCDDNVAGHSLRAGGATFFAANGWPDDRIQALGRWSSDAFKVYIRKNPVILQALLHSRAPGSAGSA